MLKTYLYKRYVILVVALLTVLMINTCAQTNSTKATIQNRVAIRNLTLPEFPYHRVVTRVEGKLSIDLTIGENGKVEKVVLVSHELNATVPFNVIDQLLQKKQFLKWTFERIGTFVTPPPDTVKILLTYKIERTSPGCPLPPKYELDFGPTITITVTGYLPDKQ